MRPLCVSTSTSAKCAAKALMRCVVLPAVVWAVPTISPGKPATAAARSRRRCGASALINWPASRRTAGAWSSVAARSSRWRLASSAASLTAAPQVIVVLDPAVMGAGGVGAVSGLTVATVPGHLQGLGSHLRQDRCGALADVHIANVHFDTPGRRDAHFRLCFAPNAALANAQGHTHT